MKNEEMKNEITFVSACKILKKSRKTLSRYIQKGLLRPEIIKSNRGTKEYRFKRADLENLKPGIDKTRGDKTRQVIRQDSDVITLLKETTQILKKQLRIKDEQIKNLLERGREANILLGSLQNKVLMLENKDGNRGDRKDKTGQKIKGFFNRLFKR